MVPRTEDPNVHKRLESPNSVALWQATVMDKECLTVDEGTSP